jgi:hypothetical protein
LPIEEGELIAVELTDDLDGGKGDLEVYIRYELDDEAEELLGVGEEVQLPVGRQDGHELVLNHFNRVSTFL